MASKEEVIFKVKAELAGFKKSMEDLKKIAKESSKNIEKSMNMDLSDEGSKAGKSFAKGLDSQMKAITNTVKDELKKVSDQASEIKIGFDTSSIDSVKRQIADINGNVSTASDRASSSMSNNANAPNAFNAVSAITSAASAASMSKMGDAMGSVSKSIKTTTDSMRKSISDVSKTTNKELAGAFEKAGQKESVLQRKIKQVNGELELLETFVRRSTQALESYEKEIEETKNKLSSLDSSSEEYAKLSEELKGLEGEYDIAKKAIDDANKRIEKHIMHIANLNKEVSKLKDGFNDKPTNKIIDKEEVEAQLQVAEKAKKRLEKAREAGNTRAIETFEKELSGYIEKIKELGYSGEKLTPLLKALNKELNNTSGISKLTNALSVLANAFKKVSISLPLNMIRTAGRTIDSMFTAPLKVASALMTNFGNRISELGAKILYPTNLLKALGGTFKQLGSEISGFFSNALGKIEQTIQNKVEAIVKGFNKVKSVIKSIPDTLKALPGAINNSIKNFGSSLSSLGSKLKSFAGDPAGSIKKAVASLKNIGTQEVEAARKKLKDFTDSVKREFPGVEKHVKKVKQVFSDMGNNIKKSLNPFRIIGDSAKKAASHFRHMGNEASSASGKVNKLKGSIGGLIGKLAMFFSIYQLFGIMKEGTQDAIKYEAAIMNLQRTLGIASEGLIDFANTNAVAFGLSKKQVAEYGNIFSVIMNDINRTMAAIGNTGETSDDIAKKTADMSQELLKSAGTIASALGYDVEYVLEGLRSGLLGSSEAVDQFGLSLKEANLKESQTFKDLQRQTGVESWNDLNEAQKQYVRTMEIINQTHAKYGSIMKNTASLHNQFLAQLANTKLALGNLGKVIWTAILPPLTQLLAYLEVIFNYAASALTVLLEMFGIKVDLAANLGGAGELENNFGGIQDTADDTSDALGGIGDSAQDSANKTEDAAKKVKRALAGFDQINVLSLGEDEDEPPVELPPWEPTPVENPGVSLPPITQQTKDNLEKFKDFIDKMKALLSELIEPFKAAWDVLGDRWIQAWNRLKQAFGNFCSSLADFLVSVWNNGGKEFVQHMAEIALAVGIAAMEIGGTILNALAKLWEHLNPETNSNTQGFLDALNEVSVKLRDLILSLNEHLETLMLHGGQDVLNAMGDCFMNLGEAAVRGLGVVIDAVDGLLTHLSPLTNEITRNMLEAWENAFKSIGDAALAFADLLESALVNGLQDVINALGDLGMQILATLGTIVDVIADTAAELFRHLDPATNPISAGALESFKYFVDSIRGFVEMIGESFRTFMDNGGQEFVNNMADIVLLLVDLAATIGGDLINAVTGFFNSWAGQVVIEAAARALELISSILKGFLEILQPLTPVISAVVGGILAFMGASKVVGVVTKVVEVFKSVGSVLGLAKTAATALWGVLAANPVALVVAAVVALGVALVAAYNKFDGFREAVDGILEAWSGFFDALKGLFSNILNDITNIFQDIIDIIVGIFTGDGQRVGEAVKSLLGNILQLFGDLVLGVVDVGINLIEGLVKGIWEGIKLIPDAITGIFNFIVDFFKGLFGINSPSTVFAEFGVNLIEGLAQGIGNVFDLIGDALSGMFDFMGDCVLKGWEIVKGHFSEALEGTKELFSDVGTWLGDKFGEGWEYVKKGWDVVTEHLGEKWDGIKDTFDKGCENVKAGWDVVTDYYKDSWEGVKDTFSDVASWFGDKFGDAWNNVKDAWSETKDFFGGVWDNVTGLYDKIKKSEIPKPKFDWGDITKKITDTLGSLKKKFSEFKWELPKPKIPSFSISGGKAPWGFMGQGSMPKISIKWNAAGGILTDATLFGMAGNTLLGGGEAGPK